MLCLMFDGYLCLMLLRLKVLVKSLELNILDRTFIVFDIAYLGYFLFYREFLFVL